MNSQISNVKNMDHQIECLIQEDVKIVSPENCYIVDISFDFVSKDVRELAIGLLENGGGYPSSVYYNNKRMILIFPPINNDQTHQLGGNFSYIISKYTREFVLFDIDSSNIMTSVIQFTNKCKTFIYMSWIIKHNLDDALLEYGNISKTDIHFKTNIEIESSLSDDGINWKKDISNHAKFGSILRIKKGKTKNYVNKSSNLDLTTNAFDFNKNIECLSCYFDTTKSKRFIKFMFD